MDFTINLKLFDLVNRNLAIKNNIFDYMITFFVISRTSLFMWK